MNKQKKSKTDNNKKQWNKLFDYEIVYHLNNDLIPQTRYFSSNSADHAFSCFIDIMKNRINKVHIDEFTKFNPYSNRKELLDIPKNIL